MGWLKGLGPCGRRAKRPLLWYLNESDWLIMAKELSVFIDESGDFGEYEPHSPYYIIGLVVHEQEKDISASIRTFDHYLQDLGFRDEFVHVGPLIRKEAGYKTLTVQERMRILRRMIAFVSQIDFTYKAIVVEKKHLAGYTDLYEKLARQLSEFIKRYLPYFYSFDKVKIYYDNGQTEIMKIIISVFSTLFNNVEFRKAAQKDYKLLQVADLICTAELTRLKLEAHLLSKSERRVLGSDRDIQKHLLKPLKKKEFQDKN